MEEKEVEVARVEDYFAQIGVVALKVTAEGIRIGDVLHFKGHTTDLIVEVGSMQIEHQSVKEAKVGDSVGIKVGDRVRSHDRVYKVITKE
jgi:translation initiation factor IF-2